MKPMLDTDYRRPIRHGAALLVVGFGGFLAWAALAPLDEAVPAAAVVSVEGKRKRVDHLTGGLVEKILVREGDRVREGEELVLLNDVQSQAALNAALSQWRAAKAAEARLAAERDGLALVEFPRELLEARDNPEAAAAMRAEERVFASRRAALAGELRIVAESVRGLEAQLQALEQLRAGRERQGALLREQLASFEKLNAQGFVSRNHLLDQERQLAELRAKHSEDLASLAGVRARLAEFRLRASQRQAEYRREVESQLAEVRKEAELLGEKLAAQRDTHARLAIRAPVAGIVVDLAAHTVGGVVKAGDRLMEIVPSADEIIVEARIAPHYIDRVRPGLPVSLHLDAYMHRADRPILRGTVSVVSADALADPRTGESYYAARIAVPAAERARLGGIEVQPGMQVSAMVNTGERSLLAYLVRPLLRRFGSALAEA